MIFDALELIRTALQGYIREFEQSEQATVILGNIAMAEELGGTQDGLKECVVMSLVNVQEESTLKNASYYRLENGRTVYQNPPVNLNLFILFSVLYDKYDTALKRLSRVVEFFQSQTEISFATTPAPDQNRISREVRLLPDLYSLTFEQLNHLWGSLGGKQVPFVLYRARLVAVESQKREAEGPVIGEILSHE